MPAGIQIINSDGFVQIDESYWNYVFRAKVTTTGADITSASSDTTSGRWQKRTKSVNLGAESRAPMIFLRCTTPEKYAAITRVVVSGGVVTFDTYSTHFSAIPNDDPRNNYEITAYIFTRPPPVDPNASGSGFRFYKADGSIVYDTTYAPLRILGMHTITNVNTGTFFTGSSGQVLAACNLGFPRKQGYTGLTYPWWGEWRWCFNNPTTNPTMLESSWVLESASGTRPHGGFDGRGEPLPPPPVPPDYFYEHSKTVILIANVSGI